jgi:HAD superfamily hydrolase (TIGR01509 family)
MKPEVIVFDLGKVLVDFDYSIAGRRIAARSRKSAAEVQDFIDHSPLLFRYETGTINRQQFYDEVCQATGYSGNIDEFARYFADIFTPIPDMVALHQRLREQRIPTFIFSNTNDLAIDHIRANFPFFSNFDDYVLSYEHGAMKPSAPLYEVVEKVTGRNGSAILYLDDRPENAEAGVARGWQVIQHESAAVTIPEIRRRGFVV